MSTMLKVTANERKRNNISILSRKLQAHMELIFKYLVVETGIECIIVVLIVRFLVSNYVNIM